MFTLIQQGGLVMWVILAGGAVALFVFMERFFHVHRAKIKTDDFLKGIRNILRRGNINEAVSICDDTPGPAAYIVRAAILHYDRGREVIALDGVIHTRQRYRPWFHRPLDGEAHELWLDDAYRAVRDAVALAGPRLAIEVTRVGPLVRVTLARSETEDRDRVPRDPRSAWRFAAEIDAVTGVLTLDPDDGAWRSATVDVRFRTATTDGRTLRGHLALEATLEALGRAPPLHAPPGSEPLPERRRLQTERDELLDGLAAR